jgi:hypothetical protein
MIKWIICGKVIRKKKKKMYSIEVWGPFFQKLSHIFDVGRFFYLNLIKK